MSLRHEGWELSSRPDNYKVGGTDASTRLYACPNIASKVTIVHADRNTPGFMRSPPETPYIFALESAMDELAYALAMDPIKLRRVNDTQVEPIKGLPYTSRHLMECFDAGAKAFGWSRRDPKPRSMRDGDWWVGYGCASTLYPTQIEPATARVTLAQDGSAKVETGTHEIGNGVRTVVGITASDRLGCRWSGSTSRWATPTCRRRRWRAGRTPPPASATWSPRPARTSGPASPTPR